MRLQIALVSAEGVTFGLVVVPEDLLDDPAGRDRSRLHFEAKLFRGVPVVLVGEDFREAPRFYGPAELTEFMQGVQMDMIEWTRVDLPEAPLDYP
jgi:hypothetical protein